MSLLKRFGYYFGGFAVGLVILAFFLNGKRVSCDYGPDARVLKNIGTKELVFSEEAKVFIASQHIDTTQINYMLYKGDVNFSKSDTKKSPCKMYYIEGELQAKEAALTIENCEKQAVLKTIEFLN
ncbi:hypothetical protein N7U66_01170 [Lacinutrix neustonica]|uniref:DUF4258 domain-containing protein n=1 Tax=Lacinutrix neustonica TaxID=2980107 RepID=A0A9E8SH60_9FLAO|nr:hypothetical protein [Lacinutrix neustonica]WAC02375.1 hypothetical protein N7U66_01170 [Lacinutrix neustonica]